MVTIEHYREGELLETFCVSCGALIRRQDGKVSFTFPPGLIELATNDEVRFRLQDLIDCLSAS